MINPRESRGCRGLTARFLRHDVRQLGELAESFDTVLDSGLFVHVVDDAGDLSAYLDGLQAVARPGGRYFMLCFSGPQPDSRARHLMREEITACFADSWRVDSIEPATLDSPHRRTSHARQPHRPRRHPGLPSVGGVRKRRL